MKPSIVRPLQLTTVAFVLLLVAAFVLLGGLALRNDDRIELAQRELARVMELRSACRGLDQALLGQRPVPANSLVSSSTTLRHMDRAAHFEDAESAGHVAAALARVDGTEPVAAEDVSAALASCQAAAVRQDELLASNMARLRVDTDRELTLALVAPLVLLGLMTAILIFARGRVQEPIRALSVLVSRLSEGALTPVATQRLDPLVLPLYENYNRLVVRLQELEAEHRRHESSLTREVQAATRALLEQHRSLSRADRLAATGELAATVAHEVRNPLAGMQVTLSNLQRELSDPDVVERLSLLVDEVTRLSRLVDRLLSTARHTPEAPRRLNLAETVAQLLTLTRYQLPMGIELRNEVPERLVCTLPEDRLRQALLNLVLNAAEAMPDGEGVVTVQAEERPDGLAITVADDGPGLPPQVLDGRARPFDTTRDHGTGLGLAMVDRFARDLGGKLQMDNREPRGAAITMLFPGEVLRG